jgi:hypothetical protein
VIEVVVAMIRRVAADQRPKAVCLHKIQITPPDTVDVYTTGTAKGADRDRLLLPDDRCRQRNR